MAPWPETRLGAQSGPAGGAQAATPSSATHDLRDLIVANCTAYLRELGAGPGAVADEDQRHQWHHRGDTEAEDDAALDKFQIIKAVVLGLVTSIILLSVCKMVFQLFVRYAGKADDR